MMTLLNVDHEKCKQDGLCANDCPAGVIFFKPGQYPELKRGAEAICLRCGHCVAICPHGAMDHAEVPLAGCPPIDPALAVTPDQAVQFLRSRRSVRRFKPGPVEQADIQRLIDIGRYAPTASNAQVLRWLVINDKSRLDALAGQVVEWMRAVVSSGEGVMPYMPAVVKAWDKGFNPIFHTAPCLVVATAPAGASNGMVDISLALSYLELAAPQFGMGTCWAGLLQYALECNPRIKAAVGIPEKCPYHYPMMIGYSKVRYYRLPERKPAVITWS